MRTSTTLTLGALLSASLAGACSSDSTESADSTGTTTTTTTDGPTLSLSFTGLPVLGEDYVYEGWLLGGGVSSSGRFSVNADGSLDASSFPIDAAIAEAATSFILTIEPAVNDDPGAAATHVVAGSFSSGSAALTIGDSGALGSDFTDASGSFFLATPTSAATDDDAYGIWFFNPPTGGGSASASLNLPTLPNGWIYEGWVVDTSGDSPEPISTGTFASGDMADSDAGGPFAGSEAAPGYPGSDFVMGTGMRKLNMNHDSVISIEPVPDDSPAPFQLKPLAGPIADLLGGANPQDMPNVIGNNTITGMATLSGI